MSLFVLLAINQAAFLGNCQEQIPKATKAKTAFAVKLVFERPGKDGCHVVIRTDGFFDLSGRKISDDALQVLICEPSDNGSKKECVIYVSIEDNITISDFFRHIELLRTLRNQHLDTIVYIGVQHGQKK